MVRTTGHRITGCGSADIQSVMPLKASGRKTLRNLVRASYCAKKFSDVAALFVLCAGRAVHVAPTRDAF